MFKFFQSASFRSGMIAVAFVITKALITWRTGLDTWHVSQDLLNVAVIDGIFLTFWLVAAYAGTSKQAMALRGAAALGAWLMYIAMGYIAYEAGMISGDITVSLIARLGGVALLLYDTWDFLVDVWHKGQQRAAKGANWRVTVRSGVFGLAYLLASIVALPVALLIALWRALADYVQDARHDAYMPAVQVVSGTARPLQVAMHDVPLEALSPSAQRALPVILDKPGITDRELAQEIEVSHTTANRAKKQLAAGGFLTNGSHGAREVERG